MKTAFAWTKNNRIIIVPLNRVDPRPAYPFASWIPTLMSNRIADQMETEFEVRVYEDDNPKPSVQTLFVMDHDNQRHSIAIFSH